MTDRQRTLSVLVQSAALTVAGIGCVSVSCNSAKDSSADQRETITVAFSGPAKTDDVLAACEAKLPSRYGYRYEVVRSEGGLQPV